MTSPVDAELLPWGKWTWRQRIASRIHRLAYQFSPWEGHELLIRDKDGAELFSVAFEGGFVATGPYEPFTLHCRHYEGDDDMEGTVEDL